ncbi:MAG: S8 family serine peptidase, partial [Geitlerinemataceae cyanobacterium]
MGGWQTEAFVEVRWHVSQTPVEPRIKVYRTESEEYVIMDDLLALNFPTNDLVSIAATPDDDALFGSSQHESILSLGGHDISVSYGGQDLLAGNQGNDSLFGNTETDILYGGKGNDWLFGGEDNDRLWGDLGDDWLSGDRGADTVTGGEGSDRFIIGTGGSTLADADIITDYTDGEDWLELTDGRTFTGLDIQPGTGANVNDTIVKDTVTGEYLAVLKDFVASGVLEYADESLTRVRLQIAQDLEPTPEIPDNPPPAGDIEDAPIVKIDREIPQLNTEERSIDTDPGNTPETAYSLPVSSTTLMYSEQVSGADTDDYYVFTLGADNSITLSLEEATGDANISLLDSNQTAIGSSPNTDAISAPLEAGTYYIRVESADAAETDYKLNLSVTPRLAGITTTDSEEEYRLFTNDSLPLINLTPSDSFDMEAFRTDPRFANIDGSGYTAVIIDSGIDRDHPFFGDRIVYQEDFADHDKDASDYDGHGSNVSSIVASGDSTYPGVAPGANIIHLKVFPDEGGSAQDEVIQQALQWVSNNAKDYNIVSVNMSLGSGNSPTPIYGEYGDELENLAEQDVIVVAASGNDFYRYEPGIAYPAANPNIISVGSVWDGDNDFVSWGSGAIDYTTDADQIVSHAQRHPDLLDIFAPGAFIT